MENSLARDCYKTWTWGRTSSLWGWRSTGTGCPGRLWSLLLWRYSRPAWTRSSTACCRWPCFDRRVGLDEPQRSLPTPTTTILWFCKSLRLGTGTRLLQSAAAACSLIWVCHHTYGCHQHCAILSCTRLSREKYPVFSLYLTMSHETSLMGNEINRNVNKKTPNKKLM